MVLASEHLTRSLLQSAFLSSHPIRSEMLLFIMKQNAGIQQQQQQIRPMVNTGSSQSNGAAPVLDRSAIR